MSYYSERMALYRITPKINTYKAVADDGYHSIDHKWFTETDKGDISINYLAPDGAVCTYKHGNTQSRSFSRVRLSNPTGSAKYLQDKGTETIPFCTPTVIEAYKQKQQIKNLFIVEGEFKAFSLSMLNQPCMGIGGIQNFKDASKTKMHPYIIDVIQTCRVENVTLIFDRDCREISWAEGKDLAKRPGNFYTALNTFNELLKPYSVQLYFAHVSAKCPEKGIDDVLMADTNNPAEVLIELSKYTEGMPNRQYVDCYQITGLSSFKLKSIFGLASVKNFVELYGDELQNRDFVYQGAAYYIDDDGKPTRSWQGQEKLYLRVGTDYYKKIVSISPLGQTETDLVRWSENIIKQDYSNPKEFLKQVEKYDGFTNMPENDPELYRATIHSTKDGYTSRLYNRYCPVTHVPQPGEWRTIDRLLHHIFDAKNLQGDSFYQMALDYLQIIYTHPTQHLPILCLVSKETGTGKTTFLELLRDIFLENMRILDSERLSSQFNSSWAGKLIVAVDESFIQSDKPVVMNRLKMIATNNTIPIEAKGTNAAEVPNFSKLIMCSNDESNFLKIDIEDSRYWIIKVNPIDPETKDTHMAERMRTEIPAFLYFLKNRTLAYPEKNRLWFDPADFATEQLRKIQNRTADSVWQQIEDVVRSQLIMARKPQIMLDVTTLRKLIEENGFRFATSLNIRHKLDDRQIANTITPRHFTYFIDPATELNGNGRAYIFNAADFYKPDEWTAIMNDSNSF